MTHSPCCCRTAGQRSQDEVSMFTVVAIAVLAIRPQYHLVNSGHNASVPRMQCVVSQSIAGTTWSMPTTRESGSGTIIGGSLNNFSCEPLGSSSPNAQTYCSLEAVTLKFVFYKSESFTSKVKDTKKQAYRYRSFV